MLYRCCDEAHGCAGHYARNSVTYGRKLVCLLFANGCCMMCGRISKGDDGRIGEDVFMENSAIEGERPKHSEQLFVSWNSK